MRILPPKPTLVILTLVALMKAPDAMPAFKNYKVLDWQTIAAVLDFAPRKTSAVAIEDEQLRMHPDKDAASYKIFRLSDPTHALDHFYEALQRTETRWPGAITRIVHYGDSPTTADFRQLNDLTFTAAIESWQDRIIGPIRSPLNDSGVRLKLSVRTAKE